MIAGIAALGDCEEAFQLYEQMQSYVRPAETTYMSLLTACSSIAALDQGKQLHADMAKHGIGLNAAVGTSLVDMYVKCGDLTNARSVFNRVQSRTVGLWTAMLGGYVRFGLGQEALRLYEEMIVEGFKPDLVTFINVVKACAETGSLVEGRAVHSSIVSHGFGEDIVLRSILVDMYVKCGSMQDARRVFDISSKDGVILNAIIQGYAKHGRGEEALRMFEQMQEEGLKPTASTFLGILKASGRTVAITDVKRIHTEIVRSGLGGHGAVASSLIEMYTKCGGIDDAREVFDTLPVRDAVLWNTMIGGYALHGQAQESLQLFELMQRQGVKPTSVTFLIALTACSHAGLLSEGRTLFRSMCEEYGISPAVEHYACLVDVLCRGGHLYEAKEVITSMPLRADVVLWKSLLAACRAHSNVELGKLCFDAILEMDPANSAAFVLMSNIYAETGRAEDEAATRQRMRDAGAKKEAGCSWIQVDSMVHTFVAGDTGR